eukprot:755091-Hanusia_phi.AAC.10
MRERKNSIWRSVKDEGVSVRPNPTSAGNSQETQTDNGPGRLEASNLTTGPGLFSMYTSFFTSLLRPRRFPARIYAQ